MSWIGVESRVGVGLRLGQVLGFGSRSGLRSGVEWLGLG